MRNRLHPVAAVACLLLLAGAARAAEDPQTVLASVAWQKGPGPAAIGSMAEIQVEPGYIFAAAKDSQRILESMQNIVDGSELGLVGPEGLDYFVVFEFDDVGYVKDDT